MIAGVGCADTVHTVRLAKAACSAGADALLVVTPYYSRPSQAGLCAHFQAVADASSKPIILYSIPSRTGITVSTEAYCALAEHPNIVGVKEANTDIGAVEDVLDACGDRLDIYAGNDRLLLPFLLLGGSGCIDVCGNLIPEAIREICRLYREGKPRLASARYARIKPLIRALGCAGNPEAVKCAMALCGLCREEYRLPLLPPNDAARNILRQAVEEARLCEKSR